MKAEIEKYTKKMEQVHELVNAKKTLEKRVNEFEKNVAELNETIKNNQDQMKYLLESY